MPYSKPSLQDNSQAPVTAVRGRCCRGGEAGDAGTDLVRFGQAEVGVEGRGVPVVLAGAVGVAEGVVGVAESGVGAGPLVAVGG
ncbi:hypothetical protein GCM10018962_90190 [Dactylosporangium matsuzakiense]|uniref:Uncharacterized protein n=1 Tax=Dactylosporangium matsuzakiense TaxID=53360 RepID=A0A9W6NLG2_9ACTN|nr:hypothetical protein GCM10017581_030600 [Dactylosporangium matsuzakiense]